VIDTVVWRQVGGLIEVIFADWRSEHRRGDRADAASLAEAAGLQAVATPEGMARWDRHPGSKRLPPGFA
jgi:hypothetical protein